MSLASPWAWQTLVPTKKAAPTRRALRIAPGSPPCVGQTGLGRLPHLAVLGTSFAASLAHSPHTGL